MTTTVTRRLKCGALPFLALALLFSVSACRDDHPPAFPVCISDGFGGCNGSDTTGELATIGCQHVTGGDGNRYYCPPSLMKDFWATTEKGMGAYSAWCYGGTPQQIQDAMTQMRAQIQP